MAIEEPFKIRSVVRDLLTLVVIILCAPLWMICWVERALGKGETLFVMCSEVLSLVPGLPGVFLRRGFYVMSLESCAWDVSIGFGTTLAHRQVKIGRRVYVGGKGTIGMATIEEDATIGCHVNLLSGRHQHHLDDPDRPIQHQGGTFSPIHIGRNCWIGNSAVVMADVGSDSVIGAGSVVVKPVPSMAVAAGNPARVIRRRSGETSEASAGVALETP